MPCSGVCARPLLSTPRLPCCFASLVFEVSRWVGLQGLLRHFLESASLRRSIAAGLAHRLLHHTPPPPLPLRSLRQIHHLDHHGNLSYTSCSMCCEGEQFQVGSSNP